MIARALLQVWEVQQSRAILEVRLVTTTRLMVAITMEAPLQPRELQQAPPTSDLIPLMLPTRLILVSIATWMVVAS